MDKLIYILYFLAIVLYAIFYFKRSFDVDLKYFLGYLIAMFACEMIASYVKYNLELDNLWVYNTLTFVEFNFLFLFAKQILFSAKTQKTVTVVRILFNVVYFLTTLYYLYQGTYFEVYNSIASISGSLLIAIVLFLFYKDFLSSNEILNYKRSLTFWIAFGLLFYYLGTIPITSILNNMKGTSMAVIDYLYNIQFVLVIFMYSCFILGALWSQKRVK
ncbi:hypothetical protein [Polaribacter atrinae]|uniref:Uncharacterized protein n=1 Tax=Polaribacter atrinae TaxID=1333662 RepID=A0A176TC94_9FLAO|nr:hypothetical protein [Polaribacter atrinae]OAD45379.1 hypothetical protein LPB303_08270 [Polaribacter atrinae]